MITRVIVGFLLFFVFLTFFLAANRRFFASIRIIKPTLAELANAEFVAGVSLLYILI